MTQWEKIDYLTERDGTYYIVETGGTEIEIPQELFNQLKEQGFTLRA